MNFTKPGFFERFIAKRFFHRYQANKAAEYVMGLEHQKIYCEDIHILNQAAIGPIDGVIYNNKQVHILPIAPNSLNEIHQLEQKRSKVIR